MTMTAQIDPTWLADPKRYAHPADIQHLLQKMRQDIPVAYVDAEGYRPFWAVTRYEDIKFIEQNWQKFIAAPRSALLPEAVEQLSIERYGSTTPQKSLPTMDGWEHRVYRRVTREYFTRGAVASLEPLVREAAGSSIHKLMASQNQTCDFARDIAYYYPLRVLTRMMGIPVEDEGRILKWTQQLFGAHDADMNEEGYDGAAPQMEILSEFDEYFMQLIVDRQSNPGDDLSSVLANSTIDGEPMGPKEMIGYFTLIATAGHDTTSNSLAGGVHALAENPEQFRLLKTDASLMDSAVEEIIRWVAPVKHFMRTATEDIEVGGSTIAKGESLALFYASGCRDEAQFEHPEVFDISRNPNKHLAFGFGPHLCLGQHIARLEIKAFLEAWLPQISALTLAGDPKYVESNFVSGLKSLPIRFTATDQGSQRSASGIKEKT